MSNKDRNEGQTEDEQTYTIQLKQEARSRKAIIESYQSFTLRLCMKWADTYNNSDKDIEEYMTGSILALIESKDKDLADLKKKNEAGEELEFLIEMLKANCRHNTYKLT